MCLGSVLYYLVMVKLFALLGLILRVWDFYYIVLFDIFFCDVMFFFLEFYERYVMLLSVWEDYNGGEVLEVCGISEVVCITVILGGFDERRRLG